MFDDKHIADKCICCNEIKVVHAPTQTTYYNSTRIWVDTPVSGGQKASENPNKSEDYLATIDPYIGSRAYVPIRDFKAIKDFKDTDVDDYNRNYIN